MRRALVRSAVAVLLAAGAGAGSAPAGAQSQRPGEAVYGQGLEPFAADGPLIAVVSLPRQRITVFDRNGVIASSPVSTGRKGFETPEGVFSIIERKEEHFSNLYDDASMPFMQRITWSGVALHAGVVPSYRASHGCIRLPEDFAERLYRTTRLNTRVVIVNHDLAPQGLSHPALPQPGRATAMPVPPEAPPSAPARPLPGAPLPDGNDERPMMLGAARLPTPAMPPLAGPPEGQPVRAVADGLEALKLRQAAAAKRLGAATRAVSAARTDVRPLLLEQGKSEKAHRQAIALARRAAGRVEAAARQVDTARTYAARALAEARHIEALLALAEARGGQAAAEALAAVKAAAVASSQEAIKALEAERVAAQGEHRQISRQLQPISVLVSRQTGRVYLRQAFHPVLDLPVTIREPGRPLGTHVFTALEAGDRQGALAWVGLTIETPGGGVPQSPPAPEPDTRRRKGGKAEAPAPRPVADPLQSARAALDRIELPAEALARIQMSLQAGSTLIIADQGHSIETGPGTDHIVQTRGEEAAAANIAKFLAKKKAEALAQSGPPPRSQPRRDAGFGRPGDWSRW